MPKNRTDNDKPLTADVTHEQAPEADEWEYLELDFNDDGVTHDERDDSVQR